MNETHVCLCIGKAHFSEVVVNGLETLRKACGGHGYSHYSGFPHMISEYMANLTLEGETLSCIYKYQDSSLKTTNGTSQKRRSSVTRCFTFKVSMKLLTLLYLRVLTATKSFQASTLNGFWCSQFSVWSEKSPRRWWARMKARPIWRFGISKQAFKYANLGLLIQSTTLIKAWAIKLSKRPNQPRFRSSIDSRTYTASRCFWTSQIRP